MATALAVPVAERDLFYSTLRLAARFWLWFLFKRVDVRHPERVPETGAVMLCINHPNNLIDSLLVGAVVTRKVHYLATAALFRHPLMRRFLLAGGAIPVYRRQDGAPGHGHQGPSERDGAPTALGRPPSALPEHAALATNTRNADTFAACHAAFDQGRLVAIYPEGTTHAEARVQRIKTGAARIALAYEAEHPGSLSVIPVGLSFEARKSFTGRVLISFGEPVSLAPYVAAYRLDPVKGVDELTTAIQWAMEAQVVHVDRIEADAIVRAVEELYRSHLVRELRQERGLAERQVDLFRISRTIVEAVSHFKAHDPERVERLWQRIQAYRALLARYRVKDEAVQARLGRRTIRRRVLSAGEAFAVFPLFAYGALVNALPYFVPRGLARRLARKETDYATTRLLASVVAFPLFWGLEIWLVVRLAGAVWGTLFALSLPLSGLVAYHYLRGIGTLRRGVRLGVLALTRETAARDLLAEREAIIAELERAREDYFAATRGSSF
ncbi:MAG TPA: 1-acyl-sn-glycerol-3-phosphate acyltransferase [Methylomirabilota bacterium]|nr:1-acyl-sn-glycerol-3-phosphate acyltransferase [Methylomirabilota bacterium]